MQVLQDVLLFYFILAQSGKILAQFCARVFILFYFILFYCKWANRLKRALVLRICRLVSFVLLLISFLRIVVTFGTVWFNICIGFLVFISFVCVVLLLTLTGMCHITICIRDNVFSNCFLFILSVIFYYLLS